MTDTNETQVEVTQADRDAAADLIEWHNTAASEWHIEGGADLRFFASDMPEGTRKGIWDEHEFVQAFARHRIQAEKRNNALAVELREAAKNTTPETWHVVPYGDGDSLVICMDETGNRRIAFMATPGCRDHVARKRSWAEIKANAALIVALRNNLPAILAALEGDE